MIFDTRLLSGIGVLAAVAETGSFTRAGEALGLTGSGISRAISRLEARVGVRLIDRSPRAVSLSPEGRAFYARIAPLLEQAQAAADEAKGTPAVVTGHLRLAADAPSARLIIAPMLPALFTAHPGLSVEIVVRDRRADLVSGGFDASVHFDEPTLPGETLTKLGMTSVVTVAAPAYLARQPVPEHPSELQTLSCILLRDPVRRAPYRWAFFKDGQAFEFRPRASVIANDATTMLAACLAGTGIAQLLRIEVEDAISADTLIKLFPDWDNDPYACWLQTAGGHFQSPRLTAFTHSLEAHCSKWLPRLANLQG